MRTNRSDSNDYRPFPYHRQDPGKQPAWEELEQARLLSLLVSQRLSQAPEQLQELAHLLSQQYQETEIAELMGISRTKVWRLKEHLRKHLQQVRESLKGDWGLG